MKRLRNFVLWAVALVVVMLFSFVAIVAVFFAGGGSANASCVMPQSAIEAGEVIVGGGSAAEAYFTRTSEPGIRAEQQANAAIIILVGRELGLSDYSIAIGVATAIQESNLRNLAYGDLDSLGLFQQRPSVRTWGTAEQIMDPYHASRMFFERLMTIPDRDQMPMMEAAILVQIPSRFYYERDWEWDAIATEIVTGTPVDQGACSGWVAPVEGYEVGSPYGWRQLPGYAAKLHGGVDIPAPAGVDVLAASSGVVSFVGQDVYDANLVVIDHGSNVTTVYAHMSGFAPGLSEGDHVNTGQVIAYVGSTGFSFGNHLHFELIENGENIDPVPFFTERGVDLMNGEAASSAATQLELATGLSPELLQVSLPVRVVQEVAVLNAASWTARHLYEMPFYIATII